MTRKIFVALPAHTGQMHLPTMSCLFSDVMALADHGISVSLNSDCGNSDVANARNKALADFLSSDCTDMVFIDWDVTWEAGALRRLIDHPVDFVAGSYPQRKDPLEFVVAWNKRELWADPKTGLLEAAGLGAGFWRISRHVAEMMTVGYAHLEFECKETADGKAWGVFDNFIVDRRRYGEDMAFCKRWTDIGGQIWIDPEIEMGHIGPKTFKGTLGQWLRDRIPQEKAA